MFLVEPEFCSGVFRGFPEKRVDFPRTGFSLSLGGAIGTARFRCGNVHRQRQERNFFYEKRMQSERNNPFRGLSEEENLPAEGAVVFPATENSAFPERQRQFLRRRRSVRLLPGIPRTADSSLSEIRRFGERTASHHPRDSPANETAEGISFRISSGFVRFRGKAAFAGGGPEVHASLSEDRRLARNPCSRPAGQGALERDAANLVPAVAETEHPFRLIRSGNAAALHGCRCSSAVRTDPLRRRTSEKCSAQRKSRFRSPARKWMGRASGDGRKPHSDSILTIDFLSRETGKAVVLPRDAAAGVRENGAVRSGERPSVSGGKPPHSRLRHFSSMYSPRKCLSSLSLSRPV